MRKLMLVPLMALAIMSCKHDGFLIKGNIDGGGADTVYLVSALNNKLVTIDSVAMKDGQFTFKGKVDVPDMYMLTFSSDPNQAVLLFLENSEVDVEGSMDNLRASTVKGSASHDLLTSFRQLQDSLSQRMQELSMQYQIAASGGTLTKELEDSIRNEFEVESTKLGHSLKTFIEENVWSAVAPYLTMRFLSYQLTMEELEALMEKFSTEAMRSPYADELKKKIEVSKRTAIGQPFIDFTQNDPEGNPIALSSLVGNNKYLLVDFWAAWCTPCRKENPNLVKQYAKYKPMGFEIFGVSFDQDHGAWLAAIENDKLTWPQVSDLGGWENAAAGLYGISSIPSNVLLDENGVIVEKNIRGQELEDKLAELFGK